MVTGSHIPFDRNGLKFYRPDGEITKADEAGIVAALAARGAEPLMPRAVEAGTTASAARYVARCVDFFGAGLPRRPAHRALRSTAPPAAT